MGHMALKKQDFAHRRSDFYKKHHILAFGFPGSPGTDFSSGGEEEAYPGSTGNGLMSSGSPGSPGTCSTSAGEEESYPISTGNDIMG